MAWWDFLPDLSLPENVNIDLIRVGDDIEGDQIQGDVVEGNSIESDIAIRHEGEIIPITEIRRIVQGDLPGSMPIDLSDNAQELILDPDNFQSEDEWEGTVKPALKQGWKEQGAVSTRSAYPILFQANRTINDEKIADILRFFKGEVFTSDYQLLRSALTIDKAMNAPQGEGISDTQLRERKRQLAEKYHDGAFSLPSMCTVGYFDEGEIFRYVYNEMEEKSEYCVNDYDRVFRVMINSKPFVAFVGHSDSTEEITDVIVGKIDRISDYDIPFPYIDVAGIGSSNHEKIRAAMDEVEGTVESIEYDERIRGDELVVRIDAG